MIRSTSSIPKPLSALGAGELHEDDGSSYTGEAPFSTPHSMPSAFRDTHASGGWAKRPPTPFSRRASLASDHSNASSRDGSFQQRMDDRVFRKGVIEVHR